MDWISSYRRNGSSNVYKRKASEPNTLSQLTKLPRFSSELAKETIQRQKYLKRLENELKQVKINNEELKSQVIQDSNYYKQIRINIEKKINTPGISTDDKCYWKQQYESFDRDYNEMMKDSLQKRSIVVIRMKELQATIMSLQNYK